MVLFPHFKVRKLILKYLPAIPFNGVSVLIFLTFFFETPKAYARCLTHCAIAGIQFYFFQPEIQNFLGLQHSVSVIAFIETLCQKIQIMFFFVK